jgi:hypothetical protein
VFHTHDTKLIDSSYLVISTIICLEPELHKYEIKDNLIVDTFEYETFEQTESLDDINVMKSKIATLENNLEILIKKFNELTEE